MPDDPKLRGAADHREVSMQEHELRNVAQRHGVNLDQVQDAIRRVGNDRARVEEALRGKPGLK